MSLPEPRLVCTLNTTAPVVGDTVLAWSGDNCIAVGTATHAFMYDLNPFDTVTDTNMHFKTQAIFLPMKRDYDCGVQAHQKEYDGHKIWQPHQAYAPHYDIYQSYLDISLCQKEVDDLKNTGVKMLAFSPIGCGTNGSTLFAILTMEHHLQIYSKKYDGSSVRWTEIGDVSGALVKLLKRNNGFYPLLSTPREKQPMKKAIWSRYAACINNFKWTSVFLDQSTNEQYVYLVTSTKMNFLIVWKLRIPYLETSEIEAIAFIKVFDEGAISCIAVYPNVEEEIKICTGNVNGKIVCITVNHQGTEMSRRDLWKDDDELTVHCMDWQRVSKNSECSVLIVAKAWSVLSLRICDNQEPSCFVLKRFHPLNICSLIAMESSSWIISGRDRSVGLIRYCDSSNTLTYENLLERKDSESSALRDLLHSVVVSPSKTFMATLHSVHVGLISVMDQPRSRVYISTLATGTKAFEVLCNQEKSSPPSMDAVESVRLHLVSADIGNDLSERDLLVGCVKHSINATATKTSLKWCFAKIGQLLFEFAKSQSVLRTLELNITIGQMVHVLKWLQQCQSSVAWTKLPVLGILKFLKKYHSDLDTFQVEIVELIEANDNFKLQTAEICSVTDEPLVFSDDGRRAITTLTKMEWPRCCSTFRALQGFHHFRSEISNTSSAEIDHDLQDLQHGRCLYSKLPMS